MGGDSCSEGCGFKTQHHILDGHFSHLFAVKLFALKDEKMKNSPGMAYFSGPRVLPNPFKKYSYKMEEVVVDELAEWSLPTPEVHSLKPVQFCFNQSFS